MTWLDIKKKLQQLQKRMKRNTNVTSLNAVEAITPSPQSKESKDYILFENLNELMIKPFYEMLESQDLSLLVKKGHPSEKILQNKWDELLDLFWQKSSPSKYKSSLRKAFRHLKIKNKIISLNAIAYKASLSLPVDEDVKAWGYRSIQELKNSLAVISTNYKIEIAMAEQLKSSDIKQEVNIYRDTAALEQILNRSIDLNTCCVSQWIEYKRVAKEINDVRAKKR